MYETSRQSRFDARYWMLGAGALGWPRGMVWGGRREEGSEWGIHVYLWQIHFDIWQNQYNIVKFKNKIKKKKGKKKANCSIDCHRGSNDSLKICSMAKRSDKGSTGSKGDYFRSYFPLWESSSPKKHTCLFWQVQFTVSNAFVVKGWSFLVSSVHWVWDFCYERTMKRLTLCLEAFTPKTHSTSLRRGEKEGGCGLWRL